MQLRIITNPIDYKKEAERFFSASFCVQLQDEKSGTYVESLVARYVIEKNKNNFYSISHKKNLVFIGMNENKIGVDIEIIKIRDNNLLEKFSDKEYKLLLNVNRKKQRVKILCGQIDKWKYFYTLWTAKEAIIKYENLLLDDIENIILNNVEMFLGNIGGLDFQNKLILKYKNKKFTVYSGQENNTIFSVCILDKLG